MKFDNLYKKYYYLFINIIACIERLNVYKQIKSKENIYWEFIYNKSNLFSCFINLICPEYKHGPKVCSLDITKTENILLRTTISTFAMVTYVVFCITLYLV